MHVYLWVSDETFLNSNRSILFLYLDQCRHAFQNRLTDLRADLLMTPCCLSELPICRKLEAFRCLLPAGAKHCLFCCSTLSNLYVVLLIICLSLSVSSPNFKVGKKLCWYLKINCANTFLKEYSQLTLQFPLKMIGGETVTLNKDQCSAVPARY